MLGPGEAQVLAENFEESLVNRGQEFDLLTIEEESDDRLFDFAIEPARHTASTILNRPEGRNLVPAAGRKDWCLPAVALAVSPPRTHTGGLIFSISAIFKAVSIAAAAVSLLGLTTVDVSAAPSPRSRAHQAGPPGRLKPRHRAQLAAVAPAVARPAALVAPAVAGPAAAVVTLLPVASPVPASLPTLTTRTVTAAVRLPTPRSLGVAGGAGLGVVTGAGIAVPAPIPPAAGGASPPGRSAAPRDPELSPQPGLIVIQSFPVGLAVAFAGLPLLLAIWLVALLRFGAAAQRQYVGRGHVALAAELGIAPARLAGLDLQELALLRDKVAFDELTGIMRRAGGLATLDREISRARRRRTPLAVAFVDIDGLKAVNDSHGHAAGDAFLKDVAGVLSGRLRAEDAIFRYGGDEFCCVLPDASLEAAGRILGAAQQTARGRGQQFSVGLAELREGDDRAALLARADTELYRGRAARGHRRRE
jgi:diguanylate cyclase (GGDEF)-like protein